MDNPVHGVALFDSNDRFHRRRSHAQVEQNQEGQQGEAQGLLGPLEMGRLLLDGLAEAVKLFLVPLGVDVDAERLIKLLPAFFFDSFVFAVVVRI